MGESTELAVFPGGEHDIADVRVFDRWIDEALDAVVTFVPAGLPAARRRRFFADTLTPIWDAGYLPVVTWEPFLLEDAAEESPVRALRNRDLLREWAAVVSRWVDNPGGPRRPLVFRPAHEMNGDWYPWSAGQGVSETAYVALWDALREAFSEFGTAGDYITWLWCANAESTTEASLSAYYPGDNAVDWVGVDGYNWGDSQPWSSWQSPTDIFEDAFARVRSISGRPLVVPEFACSSVVAAGCSPARKSVWITDAFECFEQHDVRLAGWFNQTKETDWSVCSRSLDSPAPVKRTLQGDEYAVYPAFEQAAQTYSGR